MAEHTKRAFLTAKQRGTYDAVVEYLERSGFEAGDQIEPLAAIAERIGVSLTLIQRVMRMLVEDELLVTVPRVGTFVGRARRPGATLSPLSQPASPGGRTIVRFFATESGWWARKCWREVIAAFEEEHPGVRVQLSMSAEQSGMIAGADVIVFESSMRDSIKDDLLEWVDERLPATDDLIAPLEDDLGRAREDRRTWPIMFSSTLLFANKIALAEAGLYAPQRWRTPGGITQTCDEYYAVRGADATDMCGLCSADLWASLFFLGYARNDLEPVRHEVEDYVRRIATSPPPMLVTLSDVTDPDFFVSTLQEKKALFVIGHYWHNAFIDRECWAALRPPILEGGVSLFGYMSVAVRKASACPEQSAEFARFVASSRGQKIIGSMNGLLPALKSAARSHPLYDLLRSELENGWLRETLDGNTLRRSRAMSVAASLDEVRTRGMDPDEAVAGLMAYPPRSEFTVAGLEKRPRMGRRRRPKSVRA